MATFSIPRQTDRELVFALSRIATSLKSQRVYQLFVSIPASGEVAVADDPEQAANLKYIFDLNSCVLMDIHLRDKQTNHSALRVRRDLSKPFDTVSLEDWTNFMPAELRSPAFVSLLARAREELKAADIDASLKADGESDWNRYRTAQTEVLNSLQQTLEALLVTSAKRNADLDKARDERFAALELQLRAELTAERESDGKKLDTEREILKQREKAITDREATFETKEARYVARKKQDEQVEQIKKWLEGWNLTKGTTQKRRPIFWAYVVGMIFTGILSVFAVYHGYDLLKTTDPTKLTLLLVSAVLAKSFFPLAAFTTFLIYFIRWSGAWARQHADEEFLNRARLIDIGRASWLLEAVRDAHEKGKDIPVELMKDLSRNLFQNQTSPEMELHPQAVGDILLQGLSSIRVKAPDGSEVEAKRGKTD